MGVFADLQRLEALTLQVAAGMKQSLQVAEEFSAKLAVLHPGVSAWAQDTVKENADIYVFGFSRDDKDKWSLVVRYYRENQTSPVWTRSLSDVRRALRLHCLRQVPEIVQLLTKRVEELAAALEAGRAVVEELSKALEGGGP